jgi:hypothetical protein
MKRRKKKSKKILVRTKWPVTYSIHVDGIPIHKLIGEKNPNAYGKIQWLQIAQRYCDQNKRPIESLVFEKRIIQQQKINLRRL